MIDETFTAFLGPERIARGTETALKRELAPRGAHPEGVLVFSDQTGRQVDFDLTGAAAPARPRGRPRLGVTPREITLLPRHWHWLSQQRGGASSTLRRLVEAAMAVAPEGPNPDAAYRFLTAIGGDLPGYETAIRALYAGDQAGFRAVMIGWPGDIATHADSLAAMA